MQTRTRKRPPKILSPGLRLLGGSLLGLILVLVLAGAICIPFYFESSSILYKFGFERALLRAGQVLGLVAGCLLLVQIILGARLKCLDRILGLNRLYTFHRLNGILIAAAVLIHPILVFVSDDRIFIPLQLRYWPEFVGLFLLLLVIAMVAASQWREGLRLAFHRWWPLHRVAAILAAAVFGVHVLSVSDTFVQKLPKALAYGALGLCGLIFLWLRTRRLRNRLESWQVSAVAPAGDDALCLQMTSSADRRPAYVPGQFGFITVISPHVSGEEHPFTIASSPTWTAGLEFIVRTTGDWTAQLKNLQPGDRMLIDGPFGLFSHLVLAEEKELIMVAGGIGITPMLSMLRYMADRNDQRKITLLWSNQTPRHIILPDVFADLAARLKRLHIVHVMTRDGEYGGETGRLDRPKLKRLLAGCSAKAAIFVCGPDQMMKDICNGLLSLGFRRRLIFKERFRL